MLDEDGDGAVDLSELYAEGCAAEPLPAGARGVTVTGREVNKRRRYLAKRRRADRVLAVRLVAALTRLDAVDLSSFLTAPIPSFFDRI